MTPRKASPEVTSNTRSDARSRATAAARRITIAATVLSTTLIPLGVATAAQAQAAPAVITAHAAPAPLAISVPGVQNARTFANYTTISGMRISDKVIRSANLASLTPAGVGVLERHQLRSIIDLRTQLESTVQPDKAVPGATRHSFDVLGAVPVSYLVDLPSAYRAFVTDPHAREAFRASLLDIKNTVGAGGSVLFHCSAGKDRTGWLAAVLLTVLGVDRHVVDADFLASNTFRHASPNDPLNGVNIGLLNTAFAAADKTYGSFENYVHQGLRLSDSDIAGLKKALLLPSI
ncbi:tyrosine-protein phosphatase [Gordonia sputi]|uniref:tyrosine-protein phosphatase n=1 Tax=Gordonia sputi TaxID=36823 RepID=UPI00255B2A19|nr:tyrosine-protein phosphatase [Gordonia sputi]